MRTDERSARPAGQRTFIETARRDQILQGAIATVNEIGYHRASLAEIARRTGVAKSAIVYYFGSKDALLLHVFEHVYIALDAAVEAAVAAETTPTGRLRAYAQSYLAHIDGHRHEMAAGLDIVVSHRGADGVPLYLTGTDDDTALLRSILATGMDAGEFRRMPLPAAVLLVEGLLDVVITPVQRDVDAELAPLSEEILTFLFRGLGVAPG